jgi:L-threonylcarbamoyladenylate synthase
MQILSLRGDTELAISKILKVLKHGGIIAYPTESFYALGVLATDNRAINKLFEIKKRPAEKPLPIIVGDMKVLKSVVKSIPVQAEELIKRFWPGSLTIVFEAQNHIPGLLTGNTGKIAVRIPGESVALHLAKALKFPITATSANISKQPPSEDTDGVIKYFGDQIDLIIDGGRTPGGMPSTIVDATVKPLKILRKGSIELKV